MHRTPLQDRHLLRIRRRYAADYLLYGLLPEQGNSRPVSESCLVFNEYENEKNIRPPIRTEARRLENFYAAPEEEQYFLRKYPDTYSPIDIKLLEETGTLEILT